MDIEIKQDGRVVTATLNRPDALNALSFEMMHQLVDEFSSYDTDPSVGCFLIQGSGRAFSAGADIKDLASKDYDYMLSRDVFAPWRAFAELRTPKVAAVGGYALGGGAELAMMCDIIIASDQARFGQPEIKLGLIPGMGGTQRLTKLIGKSKAMDLILTGRMMDAEEAERSGLVARVVGADELATTAAEVAGTVAGFSKATAMVGREAVNQALEVGLRDGILFEQRTYYALWATQDAQEGMAAFVEKRDATFNRA